MVKSPVSKEAVTALITVVIERVFALPRGRCERVAVQGGTEIPEASPRRGQDRVGRWFEACELLHF